ncbi:hypothetical protein GQ54DRAFT_301391 [Martensiomyces pterosporus]|nr:hypothetical protein GQ54DRAFT_301391 [Martensiomyces pterosporus]
MSDTAPKAASAVEAHESIPAITVQTGTAAAKQAESKPATQLQPLTIPAQSRNYDAPSSSPSASDFGKAYAEEKRRFQWRDLLDPEFYPEITIRRTVFFFIWTIPHIIICSYYGSDTKRPLIKRMNRTAMTSILFDVAAILVFMSPTFLMLLRRTFLPRFITFEKNIHAHKVASYTMLFWSAMHIGIYYNRYINATKPSMKKGKLVPGTPLRVNLFEIKTGWTGHVLMFSFFVLVMASIKPIRKHFFEVFYYIHHLFILNIVFLFIHYDNHLAYKYLYGPVALYCVDRLYRNLRSIFGKSPIRAVVQHPSGVHG